MFIGCKNLRKVVFGKELTMQIVEDGKDSIYPRTYASSILGINIEFIEKYEVIDGRMHIELNTGEIQFQGK